MNDLVKVFNDQTLEHEYVPRGWHSAPAVTYFDAALTVARLVAERDEWKRKYEAQKELNGCVEATTFCKQAILIGELKETIRALTDSSVKKPCKWAVKNVDSDTWLGEVYYRDGGGMWTMFASKGEREVFDSKEEANRALRARKSSMKYSSKFVFVRVYK